jgi:hypothetical protein
MFEVICGTHDIIVYDLGRLKMGELYIYVDR